MGGVDINNKNDVNGDCRLSDCIERSCSEELPITRELIGLKQTEKAS